MKARAIPCGPDTVLVLLGRTPVPRGVGERAARQVEAELARLGVKVRGVVVAEGSDIVALEPRTSGEAERLLYDALGALQWTSGSTDFAPGGAAEGGFVRVVRPLISKISKHLEATDLAHPEGEDA